MPFHIADALQSWQLTALLSNTQRYLTCKSTYLRCPRVIKFVFATWIIENTFLCLEASFTKCSPVADSSVITSGLDKKNYLKCVNWCIRICCHMHVYCVVKVEKCVLIFYILSLTHVSPFLYGMRRCQHISWIF